MQLISEIELIKEACTRVYIMQILSKAQASFFFKREVSLEFFSTNNEIARSIEYNCAIRFVKEQRSLIARRIPVFEY